VRPTTPDKGWSGVVKVYYPWVLLPLGLDTPGAGVFLHAILHHMLAVACRRPLTHSACAGTKKHPHEKQSRPRPYGHACRLFVTQAHGNMSVILQLDHYDYNITSDEGIIQDASPLKWRLCVHGDT
jgi:hypothetical protein